MKTKKKMIVFSTLASMFPGLVSAASSPTVSQVQQDVSEPAVKRILGNIITWIFTFVGFLAVLMIIWGGILYLTAAGNADRAKQGRTTLTYAIIGLIVVILSYVIVSFVANVVTSLVTSP